jgi:acyl phosphate:glycerol-3-phosphate acyltransferase
MKLFERREVLRPNPLGCLLIMLLGGSLALLLAAGLYPFLSLNAPLGAEFLVIEGWVDDEQIAQALATYHTDGYEHIIATGMPLTHGSALLPYENHAEMSKQRLLAAGVPEQRLSTAAAPDVRRNRTRAMALALRDFIEQSELDVGAVDIFSSGPHARRSRDTYRSVLDGHCRVGVIASLPSSYDRDDWYLSSEGVKSVLSETFAYAYNLVAITFEDRAMNNIGLYLIGALLSYLLGAVPFGFLIGKAKGIDVRRLGSGNIGATNVFRTVGRNWGILALLLDFLKGLLAAYLIPLLLQRIFKSEAPYLIGLLCGCAAIIGHNYSIYLKLRGGKGIATSAGMLAGVAPVPFFIGIGVWLLLFLVFRYVSLASIVAAFAVGLSAWICDCGEGLTLPIVITVMAALAIIRHHSNLKRLLAGTENRVSFRRRRVK